MTGSLLVDGLSDGSTDAIATLTLIATKHTQLVTFKTTASSFKKKPKCQDQWVKQTPVTTLILKQKTCAKKDERVLTISKNPKKKKKR